MNSEPTWAELVAREPKLGDLLAEVRAYRGHDPETFLWAPGGIADRLADLLAALDWTPGLLANNDTPLGTLWHALPTRKGDAMDPETLPVAEQLVLAQRRAFDVAAGLDDTARQIRDGAVISGADGVPLSAAYFAELAHALATLAAGPAWSEEDADAAYAAFDEADGEAS
jgi:hypothetical protein